MVGFLLRVHLQIIFFYFLLDNIPSVFIVTLGGQLLGITIIALLSGVLQSQLVSKKIAPLGTSIILLIIAVLTGCFLPGYTVVNMAGTNFILALMMIIHLCLGKYIKDR